jgi:surface antigen
MTEVYLRLADLREAAQRFQQSAARLDTVTVRLEQVLRELDMLGLDAALLPTMPQVRARLYAGNGDVLRGFATRLRHAADDVQQAVDQPRLLPHFDLSLLADARPIEMPVVAVSAVAPLPLGWYVSAGNRPMYDTLLATQNRLTDTQAKIAALSSQRETLVSDIAALRNRLLSFDPQTDLSTVRPLQGMEQRLMLLDQEIVAHQQDAGNLTDHIATLEHRLQLVQPATGADWNAIQQLETAHSPQYMVDNTYDCVQYVVSKVAIPDGLAVDALNWHQAAANLPEYGITVSETPLPGAILQMDPQHSYADDVFGHVMIVERVEHGVVWVTDNYHPDIPVKLSDITGETSGDYMRYLYLPWHTRG